MENNLEEMKKELAAVARRIRKVKTGCLFDTVSPIEYMTLEVVWRFTEEPGNERGIYVSDLAKKTNMSSSAMSRTLHLMEEKGLICREINREDRRNTHVGLTEKGASLYLELSAKVGEFCRRLFERMGMENLERLIPLLECFADAMEEELKVMDGRRMY